MIVSWIVFPLLLSALALGWGVLVERATGGELPRALLPGAGLAAIVVFAGFLTAADATAELAAPATAAVALVGLVVGARRLLPRPSPWPLAAATGVFAVYAAPIVLSGEATFAGYIKLDDTATWLTFTDHVLEHGRNLDDLAPSSYQATLDFNIGDGYPVGAFLPFGVAAGLTGTDGLWLIQPYMAWLAAVLALTSFALLRGIVDSPPARAGAAFLAAQPALLYGYYLWGGIKELAAAALIGLAAALAAEALRGDGLPSWRALLPLAIAAAALLTVLTGGGVVWLAAILLGTLILSAAAAGWRRVAPPASAFAATVIALCAPLLAANVLLPPTSSPLDSESAQGNLYGPLNFLQAVGIWPVGDFRVDPALPWLTYAACTVAVAGAAYGLWRAWRAPWGLALYGSASLLGMVALIVAGSPWVEGKALATASPALVLLAGAGAFLLWRAGRRWEGAGVAAVLAAGVLLSNVLAYMEVYLAPRDQLAELERVGEEVAGEGPSLMTEYQPYGVRHFLRDSDPEGLSELRRSVIPLRSGDTVRRGRTADLDEIDLEAQLAFRTIVLRTSPSQSRPPAPYELVSAGEYYEAWQRPEGSEAEVVAHLPLGVSGPAPPFDARASRAAVPDCGEVLGLAARAEPGDRLVAASSRQPVPVPLESSEHPAAWDDERFTPEGLALDGEGTLRTSFELAEAGEYGVWLGGLMRGRIEASVDGQETGEARHLLNNFGEFIPLGSAELAAGRHEVELEYSLPALVPGTHGRSFEVGPLLLGSSAAASELTTVEPERARTLCGGAWDWIELVRE